MNQIETAKEINEAINNKYGTIIYSKKDALAIRDFAKAQWQDELDFLNKCLSKELFNEGFRDLYMDISDRIKVLEEALKKLGTNGGDE